MTNSSEVDAPSVSPRHIVCSYIGVSYISKKHKLWASKKTVLGQKILSVVRIQSYESVITFEVMAHTPITPLRVPKLDNKVHI